MKNLLSLIVFEFGMIYHSIFETLKMVLALKKSCVVMKKEKRDDIYVKN